MSDTEARKSSQAETGGRAEAQADISIGQLVAGNVYAQQLLFNVGGKPLTLQELSTERLLTLRKHLRRMRHKRDFFATAPVAAWALLTIVLTVGGMQYAPIKTWQSLVAMLGVIAFASLMGWIYIRTLAGSSPRIQRGIAAQLEDRLILVNLELDLRSDAPSETPFRDFFREWRDSFRD